MESPERGKLGIAMEIPVSDGYLSSSPPTVPTWLRRRLSESKVASPSTVEEIEAKLRDADLRRQKFYENLVSKARPKPRSPTRSSSHSDDLGQRLEAKLLAAEEKRLSILTNAQLRLAKLDELRQVAKTEAEMRFKQERAELGTKAKMRVQKAEANRLLILRSYRQRRASVKERTSQSLLRQMARECKYKERVRAAIFQKRAAAEKKRLGLLEAEKRRAHARSMQVQKVANFLSHQRDMERREMKNKLEDRLQRARSRRAEYLMQRGRSSNNAHFNWNLMHEQAEILSIKLARCWRKFAKLKKTTAHLTKDYNDLYINEKSVKSMPFEQLALVIQSPTVLRTVKALLDRLECRYKLLRGVGSAPNSCSWDDIDHLLKRVGSPRRKNTPRKATSGREAKTTGFSGQAGNPPVSFSRYQVRVVLCAYMILGHPEAVISGRGEREAALLRSAEKFVLELDLLIKILLNGPLHVPNEKFDDASVIHRTFRIQLSAFDSSWCSFLNSFVVWKSKDARSLEEDLVKAACRLELSMIQTCKMTPDGVSGPLSHDMKAIQKQVSEDQKLLREKVLHLSGDAGIERMENALADTRMKFFNAMENRSTAEPLAKPSVSHNPIPFSFGGTGDGSTLTVNAHKQTSVVRSLFRDEVDKEANSSTSRNTLTQSSLQSLDMENVIIVNEYVHGEHLEFADGSNSAAQSQNNIMAKLRQTMENAFWDGIIESVKHSDPNYTRVVGLLREVRDDICTMAPFSWRQDIFEAIDLEVLTQVLNSGKLDIDYFGKILEFALITLQKLSAPAYENELKEKHQRFMAELADAHWACDSSENSNIITLIKGLRFVLEQIQELKQEISKARIRMLEPFLKGPEALYFLGKSFTSRYGHPSNAIDALPLTMKWLSYARDAKDEELSDHQSSISELTTRQESSNFLPSAALRTGGSFLVKMSGKQVDTSSTSNATNYLETVELEHNQEEVDLLVRLGLLKLVRQIIGLTEGELPETMILNLSRLRSVQSQVQKIIVMATSLLVLRQTLVSQRIVTSQVHMDSILSSTVKRLSECLDSITDAGIQDIIEILCTAVDKDDELVDPDHESMKDIMARMLNKSLQEDDPVFTRVSRAVYHAARGVLLGENIKQGRELAEMALQKVGATLLLDEVVQSASLLAVTAKVSVLVHGPWYANLLKH
ncbi:hypothetical protein F511_23531 [Dorcoceras hygrometricum]|uniref:T-complex protein 11 n=1 Tax=Dorcoceras hygrometricum TaxID=472368 RepID=A0A2Z7CY73_9LAMI|nr:hypothetical protein F511_23531 [Dorcoceras hygrometricum]